MCDLGEKFAGPKLPGDARSWRARTKRGPDLWKYAAGFDGYEALGDGALALSGTVRDIYEQRPEVLSLFSLIGLRVLLFMEYRNWHWADGWDGDDTSPYVRAIVSEIRARLSATAG